MPIPPPVSFALLLLVWFACNNVYAVDAELLFRRFPARHLYVDLTLVQTALAVLFARAYLRAAPAAKPPPPLSGLAPAIAALHFAASLLTNLSYALIGSTSTLMWKLAEPFSAILLNFLVLRQPTSPLSFAAVFVTLSGVLLFSKSAFALPTFSPIILSNLVFPARNVFIKQSQLSDAYTPATRFLHIFLCAFPLAAIAAAVKLAFVPPHFPALLYMLRNAALFNAYQIASFLLLERLDALTHSLLNTLKRFTAILVSMLLIHAPLHLHHLQGIAFTVLGFALYLAQETAFRAKLPNNRSLIPALVVLVLAAFITPSAAPFQTLDPPNSNYIVMRGPHYRTIVHNIRNHSMDNALKDKHVDLNIGNLVWLYAVDESLPDFSRATLCSSTMSTCAANAKEHAKKLVQYRPVANILQPKAPAKLIAAHNDMKNHVDEVLFLGLGAQVFFKNGAPASFIPGANITSSPAEFPLHSGVKALFHLLGNRGGQMLVRGNFTYRITQRFGFRGSHPVGCPSIWINSDVHLGRTLEQKYRAIAQRIGDRSLKVAFNFKTMPGLEKQLAYIRDNYPNARYYPQNEGDVSTLRKMNVSAEKVKWFTNVEDWMADLREMDVSYGLRIHGNMIAVGAGLPAIVVAPDWRVLELAQVMNIPHVTTYDKIFSKGVDVARLAKRILEEFDAQEFDRNRCKLAKVYIKVFSKYGIGVQKHVQQISELC